MNSEDFEEYSYVLCEYYVKEFPLEMSNENYEKLICDEIINNLIEFQNKEINENIDSYKTKVNDYLIKYLNKNYICRCDGNTYMKETIDNIEINKISEKLSYLKNIKQPEQRTNEWYTFRHEHLTASNLWKVFGTKSNINQLVFEKCKPLNINKYKGDFAETPMSWGQKYEDVSIMVYEDKYKTKIYDYGCIPHNKYEYLAASPDGINDCKTSPLFGRMLEIKNIYNRKITGIPKKEYWIQMQLQMEVCNLDECDFLETRFKEYESYEEFIQDGSFTHTKNNMLKGIMLYIIDKVNNCPKYLYMPLYYNIDQYEKWEEENMNLFNNDQYEWFRTIYWRLDEISCVLVRRNKYWFEAAVDKLNETWNIIKKERQDGSYIKRAPKSKKTVNNNQEENVNKSQLNDALIILY
tara:strand:- start:2082 stop:3308 length:1227 start_codon:yes stop_codon:yes gene_type:complete